jgi:hypothetical protein
MSAPDKLPKEALMNPALLLAAAALIGAGPALADPAAGAGEVAVAIGPKLQAKGEDFGPRDLDLLRTWLRDDVQRALGHAKGPRPVRAELVIEDAVPNRPTMTQLGRTPGLSFRSIGLGGARISGTVTYADGTERPLKEQFYETDLIEVRGADTWFDADRAFDRVAYDIGRGKIPDHYQGPGPSGAGHFGAPFTER